ncbi:MAG: hypothetical protein WEA31_05710, partial [Pirellulales bacterium]
LLLAVAALIKERRLRLALQEILRRLITHWRTHEKPKAPDHPTRNGAPHGSDRLRRRERE